MWDLIVSVPDNCLSFYFLSLVTGGYCIQIVQSSKEYINCLNDRNIGKCYQTSFED